MGENESEFSEETKKKILETLSKKPSDNEQEPEKVIEVRHTGLIPKDKSKDKDSDPEKEELKERLLERDAQLGTIILKEFENDKEKLLESIPEANREKVSNWIGDNPDRLENLRGTLLASGKPISKSYDWKSNPEDLEERPPSGVVGLPQAQKRYKSAEAYIDSLYEVLENPDSSPKDVQIANAKIEKFLGSIIKGRRESGRKDYSFGSIVCPKCGKMILSDDRTKEIRSCPYCGWKKYREQRA